VLDASAIVEYLVGTFSGRVLARKLIDHEFAAHMPHLAVIETTSVLRGLVRASKLSESRATGALMDLAELPFVRHSHEPLLHRVWQLRANLTAYDAAYVALAETLDATLVTCDSRLGRAAPTAIMVEVVPLAAT
jgi:predicted nucleic acid-binding protein